MKVDTTSGEDDERSGDGTCSPRHADLYTIILVPLVTILFTGQARSYCRLPYCGGIGVCRSIA